MASKCKVCGKELTSKDQSAYRFLSVPGEQPVQDAICSACKAGKICKDSKDDSDARRFASSYSQNSSNSLSSGTFANVGSKIKGIAKAAYILGVLASCFLGLYIIIGQSSDLGAPISVLIGIITISFGWLASWIWSLLIYGFGELIDKTSQIADKTRKK